MERRTSGSPVIYNVKGAFVSMAKADEFRVVTPRGRGPRRVPDTTSTNDTSTNDTPSPPLNATPRSPVLASEDCSPEDHCRSPSPSCIGSMPCTPSPLLHPAPHVPEDGSCSSGAVAWPSESHMCMLVPLAMLDETQLGEVAPFGQVMGEKTAIEALNRNSSGSVMNKAEKLCPNGHSLKDYTTVGGWCDGCLKPLVRGDRVMDCRACNWYLCRACHSGPKAAPLTEACFSPDGGETPENEAEATQSQAHVGDSEAMGSEFYAEDGQDVQYLPLCAASMDDMGMFDPSSMASVQLWSDECWNGYTNGAMYAPAFNDEVESSGALAMNGFAIADEVFCGPDMYNAFGDDLWGGADMFEAGAADPVDNMAATNRLLSALLEGVNPRRKGVATSQQLADDSGAPRAACCDSWGNRNELFRPEQEPAAPAELWNWGKRASPETTAVAAASKREVCKRSAHGDIESAENTAMTGTTVMMRNIPNKYTRDMLVDQLRCNFQGQFDFVYLPMDFKNECNIGYGFINFRSVKSCNAFVKRYNGVDVQECLPGLKSQKVVEITPARVSGLESNVRRLRTSPVMEVLVDHPEWMPLIFNAEGEEIPFPDIEKPNVWVHGTRLPAPEKRNSAPEKRSPEKVWRKRGGPH